MQSSGNKYTDLLIRTHGLLSITCDAAGLNVYAVVSRVEPNGMSTVSVGDWTDVPVEGSRAPYVAHTKAAELVLHGKPQGLSMTPIPGFEMGLGWMGGVRLDENIVGISKLHQEHDRLLALVGVYAMRWETRLHHAGHRYSTESEAQQAAENTDGQTSLVPAPDHLRWYTWIEDCRSPNGGFYIERQFWPEGKKTPARHLDFTTQDPERLLWFIAEAFGAKPVVFADTEENDPVGVVWIEAKGEVLGVMARSRWWTVPI